jgi:FkbM family methyltransferase
MSDQKVIYDFGANNGDDVVYYLKKADKVIAVEANPDLAGNMADRFRQEITDGRLVVENCVLSAGPDNEIVPFYVHKHDTPLSRFPQPDERDLSAFTQIHVLTRNAVGLISQYGAPFYVKIDLETYDPVILMDFLQKDIRPTFLSAESISINVFAALVCLGYTSFNLVDGPTVHTKYANHKIKTIAGEQVYSFPQYSSGPFGEDIVNPWMTVDSFFYYLASERLGWKDIHATNAINPK